MSENMRLKPGAVAPAFSLPNDAGETTSLADYAGERVIVLFLSQGEHSWLHKGGV